MTTSDWQKELDDIGDSYEEVLGDYNEKYDAAELISSLDVGVEGGVKTYHGVNRFPTRPKPHSLPPIDTRVYEELSKVGLTEDNYKAMNDFNR